MIEIPHRWKKVIHHSSSQQHLDKILLNALSARGTGRKAGTQSCYLSAAHPQQSKAVPDQKSWQQQLVPHVHHKWHIDKVYDIDFLKAQEIGLKLYKTFSCAVVHTGDTPAECIEKVVGHDQTKLCERPSEVTPNDPAIRADVRASGDQMLDQGQQQKTLDLKGNCVNFILQSLHKDQYQQQGTEMDKRTAEL